MADTIIDTVSPCGVLAQVVATQQTPRRDLESGNMMVKVVFRDRTWEVKPGSTVRHIIERADLNPESILAVRNGQLINDATLTEAGDTIKLVAVISGG